MGIRNRMVWGAFLLLLLAPGLALGEENRWEERIQKFEKEDAENPPDKGGILFLGSSSIVMWKTDAAFPDLAVINRGFGGSQIADSIHFAHRIAIPYAPRIIVFYAGDNDIAVGKSAETVFEDYKTFVGLIHEALPETRIVFVAIKPSIARWGLVGEMRKANALIRDYGAGKDLLDYLDVDTPMLGADGKPRKELFIKDGLHMTPEGYRLWNGLVRPFIEKKGG